MLHSLLFPVYTHSVGEKGVNIFFVRPICYAAEIRFAVIQFYSMQQSLDPFPELEPKLENALS